MASNTGEALDGVPLRRGVSTGPLGLLGPFSDLWLSSTYIPVTVWRLVTSRNFKPLFNFSSFKDYWFANFWGYFGPMVRQYSSEVVVPLLSNNATGVCLDIGPGSGEWLFLFAKGINPSITKIYGIEPNHSMHAKLRENAEKAGLGEIYEVVGCGAQELQTKAGFQPESIDTIITVLCLCSIPTPQKVISELVPLLKPGGKWILYEHVRSKFQDRFVGSWQRFVNLLWPHFFNGCDICRPTDEWVRDATDWQDVQLAGTAGEGVYSTIPHSYGMFKKK